MLSILQERPVSLKKSSHIGRLPLNSLKAGVQIGLTRSPRTPAAIDAPSTDRVLPSDHNSCPFSPRLVMMLPSNVIFSSQYTKVFLIALQNVPFLHRSVRTTLGALDSETLHPLEPEQLFKPFVPDTEFGDETSGSNSGVSKIRPTTDINDRGFISQNQTGSSVSTSIVRSTSLLSALSSSPDVENPAESPAAVQKLLDHVEASGHKKNDSETLGNTQPHVSSLNGSPCFPGGFRAGMGGSAAGGRPSSANRLSFVDRKWLERCQVFEEMGVEERPVAGNQEKDARREEKSKMEGETQKCERLENGEMISNVKGSGKTEHNHESVTTDKTDSDSKAKPDQKPARKSRGGGKLKRKDEEEMQKEVTSEGVGDELRVSGPKKRGRKRQRDGEEDELSGEREVKKKKVDKDKQGSSAQRGRKKRTKQKGDEDEDDEGEETEKKTKEPKKVRSLFCVYLAVQHLFCNFYVVMFVSRRFMRICWEKLKRSL